MTNDAWPELRYEDWAPTKKTLQMCAQMAGKTRLALAPPLPEWLHASLQIDARGFGTGPIPVGSRILSVQIDVFDAVIRLTHSAGGAVEVPVAGRCVSDIWGDYLEALVVLGVEVELNEKPQEIADVTRFSENRHDCLFDATQAQRFHRVLTSVNAALESFRSRFFGRSGIQFWWGAFDLALLLFNGEHVAAPEDRGYIMRYDLDAAHINAGFWPGDDSAPYPSLYAYIVPQPPGCADASIGPEHAGWVEEMGEWMISYDSLRQLPDPAAAIEEFLSGVYDFATTTPGWDPVDQSYVAPPH